MSPQFPTVLLRAQSDERLARLAAQGSERAFEAIVERYRRPLMGYARRIAGDSRAEDIVQAAFVNAWGRLCDGVEVRDLRAWLFRIVHNGALNAVRRASASDVELFDETPAHSDLHAEVERRDELRRTLGGIAALPQQQREALVGVAVHGRRHHDVGMELGVTDGAVRMLLHRARTTMRAAATALTPWPLVAWLAGQPGGAAAGGAGAAGATAGGGAAASGAGATSASAGLLAGAGLKTAAVLSTAVVAVGAGPQVAKVVTSSPGGTAPAPAAAPGPLRAAIDAGLPDAGSPASTRADDGEREPAARVPAADEIATPAPGAAPTAPAAAPDTAAPEPAAPPVVVQQEDDTSLPAQPEEDFLDVAGDEEDEIWVQEEAPDPSRGEQPIPAGGVPEPIAEAALPEAPAAAQDEQELAAEEAAEAPAAAPPAAPAP